MAYYDRARVSAGARSILDRSGWCVLELCVDVASQRWEPRTLICHRRVEAVIAAIETEIEERPELDVRITGCDRRTLRVDPDLGAHLCWLADTAPARPGAQHAARDPPSAASPSAPPPSAPPRPGVVREAMNRVVVTVEPGDTLREAARRMTARRVGAAVVIGGELREPQIITERDILRSSGLGQDIDREAVRAHIDTDRVNASAGWSLERASATMLDSGCRHVIVLDGTDAVGILSMRDIVRRWRREPAEPRAGDPAGPRP